jgi:GNAT superfamily N-acetyltransferase
VSRKPAAWLVEPLDSSRHDRSAFSCDAPELDLYFRDFATQDVKRDVARVFVAVDPSKPELVAGFYSLSAASFAKSGLPPPQAKRLPHYPIPAVLLGRLAVTRDQKGRGLGTHLLMDAMHRIALASQTLAVHAMVVDARDERATAFYAKHGFAPFAGQPLRLFLLVATIRQLLE